MNKGNTEGTPEHGDSVETARAAAVSKEELQRAYDEAVSIVELAQQYDISWKAMRKLLVENDVPIRSRGTRKGTKRSDSWREASAKHWNDPEWREKQRQMWLERMPTMRKQRGGSPVEKLLCNALKRARISYRANEVMLDGKYVADIVIQQKPLIIEADGSTHWLKSAEKYDAQRESDLRELGYDIVRFSYQDVTDDQKADELIASLNLLQEKNPTFRYRSDAQAFGERINARRDDPKWRERWIENLRAGQQRRRERERQLMIQSDLHEVRDDMQN